MIKPGYPYAAGKLRVLEQYIIDPVNLERMIDAPDAATAFKVFNDLDYAGEMLDKTYVDFQEVLQNRTTRRNRLLEKITPNDSVLQFLFCWKDFLNMKTVYKAKHSNQVVSMDLLSGGWIEGAVVQAMIIDNAQPPKNMPTPFVRAFEYLNQRITANTPLEMIDAVIDQQYHATLRALGKKLGSFFVELAAMRSDQANLLTMIRLSRLQKPVTALNDYIVPGGRITLETLALAFNRFDQLSPAVSTYYDNALVKAFEAFLTHNELWQLEKALEDYEVRWSRQTQRIADGPEVVAGYYLNKRNAIRNIRIVMTGKINGIAPEEIRRTLREAF